MSKLIDDVFGAGVVVSIHDARERILDIAYETLDYEKATIVEMELEQPSANYKEMSETLGIPLDDVFKLRNDAVNGIRQYFGNHSREAVRV